MSKFGTWITRDGLPAFAYQAAAPADPHHLLVGNRCIQICANADGTTGLWDERYGGRWLTLGDPYGTGSSSGEWPFGAPPVRTFGPTWFEVVSEHDGLTLERSIICPDGETP